MRAADGCPSITRPLLDRPPSRDERHRTPRFHHGDYCDVCGLFRFGTMVVAVSTLGSPLCRVSCVVCRVLSLSEPSSWCLRSRFWRSSAGGVPPRRAGSRVPSASTPPAPAAPKAKPFKIRPFISFSLSRFRNFPLTLGLTSKRSFAKPRPRPKRSALLPYLRPSKRSSAPARCAMHLLRLRSTALSLLIVAARALVVRFSGDAQEKALADRLRETQQEGHI